jgi:hypothetical protein
MDIIAVQQNVPSQLGLTILDNTVDPPVALNLTGLTVFISVKRFNDYTDDDALAIISSKITVHTFPLLGMTDWTLTASETFLPLGKYKADVRVYTNLLAFVNSDTFEIDIVPIVTKRLI